MSVQGGKEEVKSDKERTRAVREAGAGKVVK
jgi:hypothetical protein